MTFTVCRKLSLMGLHGMSMIGLGATSKIHNVFEPECFRIGGGGYSSFGIEKHI